MWMGWCITNYPGAAPLFDPQPEFKVTSILSLPGFVKRPVRRLGLYPYIPALITDYGQFLRLYHHRLRLRRVGGRPEAGGEDRRVAGIGL